MDGDIFDGSYRLLLSPLRRSKVVIPLLAATSDSTTMKTLLTLLLCAIIANYCNAQQVEVTNTASVTVTNKTPEPAGVFLCVFVLTAVLGGGAAILYLSSDCGDEKEHTYVVQRSTDYINWYNCGTNKLVLTRKMAKLYTEPINGKMAFYRTHRVD